jgi:hypothetical protein
MANSSMLFSTEGKAWALTPDGQEEIQNALKNKSYKRDQIEEAREENAAILVNCETGRHEFVLPEKSDQFFIPSEDLS